MRVFWRKSSSVYAEGNVSLFLFLRFGVWADCFSEFVVKNCQGHFVPLGADE